MQTEWEDVLTFSFCLFIPLILSTGKGRGPLCLLSDGWVTGVDRCGRQRAHLPSCRQSVNIRCWTLEFDSSVEVYLAACQSLHESTNYITTWYWYKINNCTSFIHSFIRQKAQLYLNSVRFILSDQLAYMKAEMQKSHIDWFLVNRIKTANPINHHASEKDKYSHCFFFNSVSWFTTT